MKRCLDDFARSRKSGACRSKGQELTYRPGPAIPLGERDMKNQNYSISFAVDQSPEQVFNAISNVRDGGQERSKAKPTSSAPNLRTAIKICTVPNRRSQS